MSAEDLEHRLEHYLQGHFHPDVQPSVRREIRVGTVSIEGFLRLTGVFQANHEALDASMVIQEDTLPVIERTDVAQLSETMR